MWILFYEQAWSSFAGYLLLQQQRGDKSPLKDNVLLNAMDSVSLSKLLKSCHLISAWG